MKAIVNLLVFSLALWLTTLIVGGSGDHGIWVESAGDDLFGAVLTFFIVSIIFAAVNMTIGAVIRFISIPLRILTLGLFSIVINALLLMLVGWISGLMGFGLEVENFGWALLGAIVLAIINMLLNMVFRTKRRR